MSEEDAEILARVRGWFRGAPPDRLGIAVSGGGDSVALLHILTRCFGQEGPEVFAATVDHGLRPEAADEAAAVGRLAGALGVAHDILRWDGWDGAGNLQDRARQARYALLTDWAKTRDIHLLATAHTADDQAETLLMRLGRSAGVDGLSGIPEQRVQDGITLIRPMLGITREALRAYLRRNGVDWAEDPSNEDDRFDRIKARRAVAALRPLGIMPTVLSDVARHMSQARAALDWHSFLAARDLVTLDAGDVLLDLRGFRALPEEIARRLLIRAILWVGGGGYPPRRAALAGAIESIRRGETATLSGCLVLRQGGEVRVCREFAAVRDCRAAPGAIWDGRWRLIGPVRAGMAVGPLGRQGLSLCPDWRATGRPGAALSASPAVWDGDDLVAAPVAGLAQGWAAETLRDDEEFLASILSH